MEGIELGYQDSPEFNGGEGIPMEFCNYMAYDVGSDSQSAKLVPRGLPTGRQKKQEVRQLKP